MKLEKRSLNMMKNMCEASNQITVDEDFNVPDVKADVGRMIQNKGNVTIEDIKISDGKIIIKGYLDFLLLYVAASEDHKICKLEGRLNLLEYLNLKGLKNGDKVCLTWDIEDLSIHLINSRKLNIKALLNFQAHVEQIQELQIPVKLENEKETSVKTRTFRVLNLKLHKKDTIRVREEMTLPSNKPNIQEILWENMQMRGLDIRCEKGKIYIQGELFLFLLYDGSEDGGMLQWIEQPISFIQEIECPESEIELISNIRLKMLSQKLEIKPDIDGEERAIETDYIAQVDIDLYEEQEFDAILDIYSPLKEYMPVCSQEQLASLLVKNYSKCKITERLPMNQEKGKILQICHSEGTVKVDKTTIIENGILVEAVAVIHILYIAGDDEMPIYALEAMIPFTHTIEVEGIHAQCHYYLQTDVEQLSASMPDSREAEIKLVVNMNVLCFENENISLISEIKEQNPDKEKLQNMPGIVGYKVQKNDTLWDIAKKFYTTVDEIKAFNGLSSDNLNPSMTLILMKKVES